VVEELRYLDRFEFADGRWLIAHRRAVVDWRYQLTVGVEGGPPFPADWTTGRRSHEDPSNADVGPAATLS
jgi:hypothetical protein